MPRFWEPIRKRKADKKQKEYMSKMPGKHTEAKYCPFCHSNATYAEKSEKGTRRCRTCGRKYYVK